MPQSDIFLAVTAQTGAINGSWFSVPRDTRTHIPVVISLQAGTATWLVEGRNLPADDAQLLNTGSADAAISVIRCAQMRVILSAATGANIRATADVPMQAVV